MKAGRPTKYKAEFADQAYKLCLLGHTDEELAKFFEVNTDTIYTWKKAHSAFSEALKSGKEIADGNVTVSLYKSAMGYEHDDVDLKMFEGEIIETKIRKYYPPNATSAIFWLKNRQKDKWRDRHVVDHGGQPGNPVITEATQTHIYLPEKGIFEKKAD